jgi:hypothetical protein
MSRHPRRRHAIAILLVLAGALVATLAAGCGDDDPVSPNGDPYLAPTTPLSAVRRTLASYAAQDRVGYGATLTSDFGFEFSPDSDSAFAAEYNGLWNIADEDAAALHFFMGQINHHGDTLSGARDIDLDFTAASELDDPAHADSTSHYRLVRVPQLGFHAVLDDDEELAFELPYDFLVVRGDVASLAPGQIADSTLWYVRGIVDQSPAPSHASTRVPATRTHHGDTGTWGGIRGVYRH